MPSRPINFGVLSTANISNIIVNAIKVIPDAQCVAIASRDITKAKNFAKKHDIPQACSYSDILTLPIDAVYIPLPTSLAVNWAVLCAKAGKHVLVDKPLGSSEAVQVIIDTCDKAGVIFLDGTHFVHTARTKEVQKRILEGDIGKIRRIDAAFSYPIPRVAENIRSDITLEPQGFLGDLGWYCARAAVSHLGADVTSRVVSATCTANFHPQFPDIVQSGAGVVVFETEDDTVSLCYAFDAACSVHQRVAVIGELGMLEVLDFVIPPRQCVEFENGRPPEQRTTDTEYLYERTVTHIDNGDDFHMVFPCRDRVAVTEPRSFTQSECMIEEFCRLILDDDRRKAKIWAKESLATQGILDAIMAAVEK